MLSVSKGVQPVAWIEWVNDRGVPIRYLAQDIR